MKYVEGFNRSQTLLFPQCIDEILPEDSEVRIIDTFVDALPLEEFGFLNHKPLEEGRLMYQPTSMNDSGTSLRSICPLLMVAYIILTIEDGIFAD